MAAPMESRISLSFISFLQYFVVLCTVFLFPVVCSEAASRKISFEFNPGCNNLTACTTGVNGSYANVAHISAVGPSDSLHYVVSSIGKPTVLVTRMQNNKLNKLSIDWKKLLSKNLSDIQNSITFKTKPMYTFAVVFNRLIEYNDTQDHSTLAKAWTNSTIFHNFTDFQWSSAKEESNTTAGTVVLKTTPESSNFFANGSLSLRMNFYNTTGRENSLPHLLFNDNMTMFDFTIDHMKPSYKNSRFALEMIMVTSDNPADQMLLKMKKSLDDEYTPGIFKIIDWRSQSDHSGGYVQWKPVCYKEKVRSMANSTSTRKYDLQNVTNIPRWSLAYAYFGHDLTQRKVAMKANNVSFGLTGDKFYTGSNYTAWTASIGYGVPSEESLSVLVIAIIGAGLGIPVVIIIIGSIIMCVKRKQGKLSGSPVSHGYTSINA